MWPATVVQVLQTLGYTLETLNLCDTEWDGSVPDLNGEHLLNMLHAHCRKLAEFRGIRRIVSLHVYRASG